MANRTVEFFDEALGFAVTLGAIEVTECEMVTQFKGTAETPPQFTRGYGLAFGHAERKAMAMALVDRALRHRGQVGQATRDRRARTCGLHRRGL